MTREETREAIKVMEHYANGGEVEYDNMFEGWIDIESPSWNWGNMQHYRIKEYTYPMWFKEKHRKHIVKFDSLRSGELVSQGENRYLYIGYKSNDWPPHTNKDFWTQVDGPKQQVTEMTVEELEKKLGVSNLKIIKG